MIFSYFKHYFILFILNEYLAVTFAELVRCGSYASHLFLLFTQDYLSEHSCNLTSLILQLEFLPVTCILLSVNLYGWSNSMYPSTISPLGLFQGIICDIVWTLFLYIGRWDFWKIIDVVEQDFLVKIEVSPCRGLFIDRG